MLLLWYGKPAQIEQVIIRVYVMFLYVALCITCFYYVL